ncbi:MAG: hypothetical protein WBA68_02075 [Alteraurantiacibacter sp.]
MRFRVSLALASALSLQGCILAAAAVPVLVGGAMVGNAVFGERTRQAVAEGNDDLDADDVDLAELAGVTILDMTELPAPDIAAPTSGPYAALRDFTLAAVPGEEERAYSALLETPSTLQPTRAACEAQIPAVLVDLDPAEGLVSLEPDARPDLAFVSAIAELRRQGVAIAWMTDREPTEAGAIRRRLAETGLDPAGRDPLFVQRFPGEEKQRRRRALLETHCLLAIAGDDRRDFDDLYNYLRDPGSATSLEAMIGSGWFLIPTPLD